ncbi:AEC family transporter [Spirochaeta isovalerica]|uniref:Uncharacterized protein n=1 Tax=Spirochaeta isovalerica TaxID=150 RepID=A0A841R931_9SPIO|nr:hypothetical protein [Spirochaeta isovalerica]MBB6479687.1 hypothetical protein [Spirochaeta isovalerica]
MNSMVSYLLMIFLCLAAGYGTKQFIAEELNGKIRISLQKLVIAGFIPFTVATSIWIAPIRNLSIVALPFLGMSALAAGSFIALFFSRILKKDKRDGAVFFVSGGFTNLGSIGGLLSFLFLGEQAFALVSFYMFFEKIWYFGFGFPYARRCSYGEGKKESMKETLRKMFVDPFVIMSLLSMVIGVLLNYSGLDRPAYFERINGILVPLGTYFLIFSIGLGMRLGAVGKYWKEGLIIVLVKSLITPVLMIGLSFLFGLDEIAGGLPLKTVVILSSMPVAFVALVPPSVYKLNLDLANSLWLISNGSLVIIIPVLSKIIPLL